jgi:phosphorylase kinase alpha/beta subunit
MSVIFGQRHRASGATADHDAQIEHFNRSLGQLTDRGAPNGEPRCPEAYYLEKGRFVPNDHVPLLWTQANLWIAFEMMRHGRTDWA